MKRPGHSSLVKYVRRTLVALAAASSLLVSTAPAAQNASPANQEETIAEVRPVGNRTVPFEKIMAEIKTRAGLPPDRRLIEEDVRRLVATKQFLDVRVEYVHEPHGLVVLFRVLEGNKIREIVIEGNQSIAAEKLREKAGLKPEKDRTVDITRARDAARLMEDLYHEKNYPFAEVTVAEGDNPGDGRLVFRVIEGPKVVINDVDFVFLDHDTLGARVIATKIKTRARKFGFYGGKYSIREIDEDVQRITAYYRSLGFFDVKVSRECRE